MLIKKLFIKKPPKAHKHDLTSSDWLKLGTFRVLNVHDNVLTSYLFTLTHGYILHINVASIKIVSPKNVDCCSALYAVSN